MSPALASLEATPKTASTAKPIRVNAPDDQFEHEANRVADLVASGNRVGPWSLSSWNAAEIRKNTETETPVHDCDSIIDSPDGLEAIAQTFLKTEAGRHLVDFVHGKLLARTEQGFVETPAGAVFSGRIAAEAISEIARTHRDLPPKLSSIPLDRFHPGLSLQINSLQHPRKSTLVLSFTGARPCKRFKEEQKPEASPQSLKENASREATSASPSTATPGAASSQRIADISTRHPMPFVAAPLPARLAPMPMLLHPVSSHNRRDPEEEKEEQGIRIQRQADNNPELAPDVEGAQIATVLKTPGQALDRETRRIMESRIGFDFSRVQIHADSSAAASARALGARAYTLGEHVVFASGRYSPRSTEGRRLLAHELTHVVQQSPQTVRVVPAVLPVAGSITRTNRMVQRSPEEDAKSLSISDLGHPIEALKKIARRIPGYELFTVILGHDPISGTEVERNGTNLVGGFLKLIGKQDTFENLQKSGALDRAFDWLKNEINQLAFSIEYFKGLVKDAINSLQPSDIFNQSAALTRIYEIFKPPFVKAKEFASHVLDKVFEFVVQGVLDAVGATGVFDMLRKAGAAFSTIIQDPVGFLGHLVDSLKQGFNQFKDNILEHLKNAVLDWLFGEIASTGLTIPKPFNFASVVNLLLQVLGLTYSKLRARLVKALGSEQAVVFLETSFEFLATIATKGLAAAWKMILEKADNLIETVLSAVKDWAITNIVTAAVAALIKLFNPAGAIIQAIQLIYGALRVFIEKAKQIAALISAIADSLSEIAAGNIAKAANFIESTMAKTLPIILNFLAGQLGLGGIGEKIREIIHNIQDKVGAAVDKVLAYIVEKGKALWESGKGAVASVVEWWKARKEFKLGDEKHSLYMEGDDGDHPKIIVESSPSTLELFLDNVGASGDEKTRILDLAKKVRWRKGEVQDSKKGADDGQARFDDLFEAIKALKVKGVTMPESEITNDPERHFGAASGVTAFLSIKNRKGTRPNDRNDPPAWTDLGSLLKTRNYIRGHLLNDRLGGLGEWENMMPLTNTSNGDFFRAMEKPVIDAVSTGKLVWVEVKADYNDQVTLPTDGSKDDKERAAQTRLIGLKWSYGPATYTSKWEKVKDPKPEQIKPKSDLTQATR
ncbi:MAG TPA: DUF4157 domain-containing protein [Terracidiphilus sp.]|jgi:hypothetical protein